VITKVRLVNFACHKETQIAFPEGLTIFLGRNGSGKSSVIDAITYALYGKHTRGSKANIVRDGSSGGMVELEFDFRGKHYKIVRSFNAKGDLESVALLEDGKLLVVGERKRDEAVVKRVEKLLGMNYDRMRTAVVVQQGELDRILSAKPKELKELFDDLMGLTAMEKAYQDMYQILKDFEKRVVKETGRSIQEADRIDDEIRNLEEELKSAEERKSKLREEISKLEAELKDVETKIEELKRAKDLFEGVKLKLTELKGIVDKRLQQLRNILDEARECAELLSLKHQVEKRISRLKEIEEKISETQKELGLLEGKRNDILKTLRELEEQLIKVEGDLSKVRTLDELLLEARSKAERLRDDAIELGKIIAFSKEKQESLLRLQVDQEVEEIVGLVSEAYKSALKSHAAELLKKQRQLENDLRETEKSMKELQEALTTFQREKERLSKLNGKDLLWLQGEIRRAEEELEKLGGLAGVNSLTETFKEIRRKADLLKKAVEGIIPLEESLLDGLDVLLSEDEQELLTKLKEEIIELKEKKYDARELEETEKRRSELIKKIHENRGILKELEDKIEEYGRELEELRRIKGRLIEAKQFYELLEKIRNDLYHRDGMVLKSLRTWIFGRVSDHARRYLDIFDVRIDDVKIEESGRAVVFKCYYRGREVNAERLSGGEKVALALAIRLAIGDVLGAQRLGFFILDEPTVHLDSENRRKLLDVFTSLSRAVRQAIIITHDEEIFEGAEAKIVKFERGLAPEAPTMVKEVT